MALLLNKGTDWDALAREAKTLADQESDPTTKAWLKGVATEYERLARRDVERPAKDDTTSAGGGDRRGLG